MKLRWRWPFRSFFSWRRPARSLDRIAAALEEQNAILRRRWNIRDLTPRPTPHVQIQSFDLAAANKKYHDERKELMLEGEDD